MKDLYIDFDGVIYNSIDVSYKIAEEEDVNKNKFLNEEIKYFIELCKNFPQDNVF